MGVADKYAARILMVSFFLPMKPQVWVLAAVCVYLFISALKTKTKDAGGKYKWAGVLGIPLLIFVAAIPFTPHEYMRLALKLCEQRASLLLMPFLFAFIGTRLVNEVRRALMYFVYSCMAMCIVCNGVFAYNCLTDGSGAQLNHVAYRTFFHHFTDVHPTYMSLYVCFSICILLVTDVAERKQVLIKNTALYLLFIFLLALGAKMPIIAMIAVFAHYAWSHRKELHKYRMLAVGLLTTTIAAWLFIPFVRQRIMETAGFFGITANVADNSVQVRKVIWNMDVALLKQYWLTGVGPGRIVPLLQQHYFFYSLVHPLPVGYYDTHNEYVFEWLTFGIVGIVMLVAVMGVHFSKAIRSKNHLYLYLLLMVCVTCLTESVLSLQRGVVFFAVFTSMMFFLPSGEEAYKQQEIN